MEERKMINKGNTQPEQGFEALANEIVKCACLDYLDALRKLKYWESEKAMQDVLKRKTVKQKKQAEEIIKEERRKTWGILRSIENFFFSQWCYELCDVPPRYIIKILHERFYNYCNRANEEIWSELKNKSVTITEFCKLLKISAPTLYQRLNKELPTRKKREILKLIRQYAKQRDLV